MMGSGLFWADAGGGARSTVRMNRIVGMGLAPLGTNDTDGELIPVFRDTGDFFEIVVQYTLISLFFDDWNGKILSNQDEFPRILRTDLLV
jgi:hypothetical protein